MKTGTRNTNIYPIEKYQPNKILKPDNNNFPNKKEMKNNNMAWHYTNKPTKIKKIMIKQMSCHCQITHNIHFE